MRQPADFLGTWTLTRALNDHMGQMNGVLTGTATWTARTDGGLDYAETGVLTLTQGGQMTAERRYIWQWDDDGVAVSFADGAPFHHFRPEGLVAGTTHLCGDDIYNVAYDFTTWPNWTASWAVTGPRKNYTSRSRYAPAPVA